jgi:hypothetical protein
MCFLSITLDFPVILGGLFYGSLLYISDEVRNSGTFMSTSLLKSKGDWCYR